MFVVLRQGIVAMVMVLLVSHVRLKYILGIWSAIVFGLALYGSATTTLVWLPGKGRVTGKVNVYKATFFLPYYAAVLLLMIGSRLISKSKHWKSYSELADGVYVGDYYSSFLADMEWVAIVDITNELPRMGKSEKYLNIQSWDGCPPTVEDIQRAVEFVKGAKKPVLIHCAHGKGRSATVACAVASAVGSFKSLDEAIAACKRIRPQTSINLRMRARLSDWSKVYLSKTQ